MARNNLSPQEIVEEWRDAALPEEDPTVIEEQRDELVARMQQRLRETVVATHGARRRARYFAAFGAIAACAALGFGAWRLRQHQAGPALATVQSIEGSVSVTHAGQTRSASADAPGETMLSPGDNLVTATDGRTRVELADGVSLTLGAASRLHLPDSKALATAAPSREQIRLDEGIVQIRVPHLTEGRSFSVRTPDAEVTVHGTAFSVEVGELVAPDLPLRSASGAPDATLTTRVRVSEGVVSVMSAGREVFVRKGMQWVSPRAEPVQPSEAPKPSGVGSSSPSSASLAPSSPLLRAPQSSLAEQNKLLETAGNAARTGNPRGAIGSLNELLRRYPGSSLAPEAHIQLFRALAAAGDAAGAAREARRYLAAYPAGAAREEAQKMALGH
jgi:hypothetical protein